MKRSGSHYRIFSFEADSKMTNERYEVSRKRLILMRRGGESERKPE